MNRQMRRAEQRRAAKAGVAPMGDTWTPLTLVENAGLVGDMAAIARRLGVSVDMVEDVAGEEFADARLYYNSIYEVIVRPAIAPPGWTHLTIRRRDGGTTIPWLHKQMIKDQLVGEECEAVELFPAQSRMLDLADAYHLWCNPDTTERLPIGYDAGRTV